ncbi:MAG: calcium/sodium antiporter [Ruminococcaceae bacterium]|nr:calcium/sodium antiporter [Oscillospiraceae bacterium]
MPLNILLFVVGLVMLIKGGDWFVDSASGIARRFRLPELLIGATVVSIGTTLPEVMVSAQGAMGGNGGMAYGNAIGSIICNTSLIAAVTIAIKPAKVERKSMMLPVSFFFVAAIFYVLIAYLTGMFSLWVGIVLLVMFVAYMTFTVLSMKKPAGELVEDVTVMEDPENFDADADGHPDDDRATWKMYLTELVCVLIGGAFMIYKGGIIGIIGIVMLAVFAVYSIFAIKRVIERKDAVYMLRDIFFIVVGAAVIAGGANLLVDSGTAIAEELGVPQTVIALTFVALGTSLPELVTAVTSLIKGHGALSLGNIIGANLFNLVLVSGVSTVISPFPVPSESQLAGMPLSLVVDIPVMLGVMLLLTVPTLIRGKLSRWQGIVLLLVYAGFCAMQFALPAFMA